MMTILPKIIGFVLNLISFLNLNLASKWALDLFSKPMKGRFKTTHPTLNKSEQSILYHKDLAIQVYHWKGRKETILLAHGWESNSGRWKNTILKLQKLDYNIVALDAPAHGSSGGTAFNAILYSEFIDVVCSKFEPTVLIGHSVGGMALSFFLKNSAYHKAEKLIILGAPAGFPGIFKNYSDLMGYNKRLRGGIESTIIRTFGKPSSYFNTANFLQKITTCKGLVIHDESDPIIPYSDAQEIASAHQNSVLITTKGLGHGLKGQQVVRAIVDFLEA